MRSWWVAVCCVVVGFLEVATAQALESEIIERSGAWRLIEVSDPFGDYSTFYEVRHESAPVVFDAVGVTTGSEKIGLRMQVSRDARMAVEDSIASIFRWMNPAYPRDCGPDSSITCQNYGFNAIHARLDLKTADGREICFAPYGGDGQDCRYEKILSGLCGPYEATRETVQECVEGMRADGISVAVSVDEALDFFQGGELYARLVIMKAYGDGSSRSVDVEKAGRIDLRSVDLNGLHPLLQEVRDRTFQ